MNFYAIKAIYRFEMNRTYRTILQSIVSPVISTVLYFVVFGTAIGSRIENIDNISYGAFIVPGLIMLNVLTQSISNAAFGIYFPKFTGTINEILSAPISFYEIIIGYVGAAASKSFLIGSIIFITANFFVTLDILHPIWMFLFFVLTCTTFSLFGFIIGLWAKSFDQLNLIPLLIVTPLVFLGGSFYSISMLPDFWQKVTLLNPVLYIISAFRWSFFGNADVPIILSISAILVFKFICLTIIWWIFRNGYIIKQ